MRRERMRRRLESHDHADRPRTHLGIGHAAGLTHAMDLVQRLAPELRLGVDLDQQTGEGASRELGRGFQRFKLAGPEIRVDLQHAAAGTLHALGDAEQLGLAGAERRREAAVARLVLGRARRGEAHCTGAQRLLGEPRHLLDLAFGRHFGVIGAAVAHHVEAQRAVWQLCGHVDGALHRRQGIEIVREGLPVELHALAEHGAGNILDAFHQVDQVARGTGPDRGEADAAIAEHGGRHAMPGGGRDERVPGRLPVIVGVDVDEARCHHQPVGVDLASGGAEFRSDRSDAALLHCDIGDPARCA